MRLLARIELYGRARTENVAMGEHRVRSEEALPRSDIVCRMRLVEGLHMQIPNVGTVRESIRDAGLDVAISVWDSRINLVAYQVSSKGVFVSRPVHVTTVDGPMMKIPRRAHIPRMIHAVLISHLDQVSIYAFKSDELEHLLVAMEWRETRARYLNVVHDDKLRALLEPYHAQGKSWLRFFEEEQQVRPMQKPASERGKQGRLL